MTVPSPDNGSLTFDAHYRRLRTTILDVLVDAADCLDSRTAEMCRGLSNQCCSLFVFVKAERVSPTNNAAEQSLRKAVIFRKLSIGTESGSGSRTLPVEMSMLETCRRLGRCVLDWITTTAAVTSRQHNRPAPQADAGNMIDLL